MLKSIFVGSFLGCAQLMLGLGMNKLIPGITGLVLEVMLSLLSPIGAFILFPCYAALMLCIKVIDVENRTHSAAQFVIVGVNGPLTGKRYVLGPDRPLLEFGRESNEVKIPDGTPGVSGHHCKVSLQNGRPYLMDLSSRYGTFLLTPPSRLEAMKDYELHNGAEFCLASNAVVFQFFVENKE